MTGLRVELEIESPPRCPVAASTAADGGTAREVTWNEVDGTTVEQFELDGAGEVDDSIDPVFSYDDVGVYEFERQNAEPCPCEHVEELGYPIADVRAEGGSLYVTLHLGDGSALGDLLSELREAFDGVSIRTLVRDGSDGESGVDIVPIDRGKLTERQREVVETAYEMGYFEYPRDANATEVASELGICSSTLAEHLAAAQTKLLEDLLGEAS